ncbi:hypothetical protein JK361_33385 [Streptomyces sp. 5-8]|uniref:Uncharacterized protein n=1 Tax=Streptomyces musisoli TaxID=2802280 RepID=A0ABS1PB79_9ACTN|nr:hypothetical protein [Streptomyces musisoli]MBL1109419.1 hypothetical protein [Streptomyces musisoli]
MGEIPGFTDTDVEGFVCPANDVFGRSMRLYAHRSELGIEIPDEQTKLSAQDSGPGRALLIVA